MFDHYRNRSQRLPKSGCPLQTGNCCTGTNGLVLLFQASFSFFYDLAAFVVQGAYADSQLTDSGFAHNTPMDKHKFKTGLNVTAGGSIPAEYALWSGRTPFGRCEIQARAETVFSLTF